MDGHIALFAIVLALTTTTNDATPALCKSNETITIAYGTWERNVQLIDESGSSTDLNNLEG